MVNICLSCSKYPFCKDIEENKNECENYKKVKKKLVKKEGKIIIFENIKEDKR